nr:MAG TPA: hypothetical protein [Siphoviridae sp. ctEfY6]
MKSGGWVVPVGTRHKELIFLYDGIIRDPF